MTTAAPSTILGRHVWSELMTTDPKAAEAFYNKIVGWTSEPFAGSPTPYTQFKRSGGSGVAGLMQRPADMHMPPFWSMYIAVPNFEHSIGQLRGLGGRELSPVIDIPGVGRMQMVTDPQGAALYIMQPEPRDQQPPDQDPQIGEASWLELMSTDATAGMTFYQEMFGWQPSDAMDMGPMGTYQMFNRGERMIGGMMNKPPELAQVPPHWRIYFRVPDINSATERITGNGGKILHGPMEVPGGDWVVNGMDPQGAAFALHQTNPAKG